MQFSSEFNEIHIKGLHQQYLRPVRQSDGFNNFFLRVMQLVNVNYMENQHFKCTHTYISDQCEMTNY